jgi:S-methylmethionine-dependent homocysteine/selenocysteine methylase
MSDLSAAMDAGDLILVDGAMGTELERRGVPMNSVAWSAEALDTHPHLVREIHEDFIQAEADVHIANTFACARHVLEPAGLGNRVESYNRRAVHLAREAVANAAADRVSGRTVWIAGSLSSFAEGGDRSKAPDSTTLRRIYDEQIGFLVEEGVDLLALEMLAEPRVSRILVEAAAASGLPLWLGITCRWGADGKTIVAGKDAAGLPQNESLLLADLLPSLVAALPGSVNAAVGIMHSNFDVTDPALDLVARHWDGPRLAYPHSGGIKWPKWQFDQVCSPDTFASATRRWVDGGVAIIGGCCGIEPRHIAAMTHALRPCLR